MLFYTCCTQSHLAQAKILARSLQQLYPHFNTRVLVFLVDNVNNSLPKNYFNNDAELVVVDKHFCNHLTQLTKTYTCFELVCYMKSFAGLYLLGVYPEEKIVYLDTDILAFHRFDLVEALLDEHAFIITPHITEPTTLEEKTPEEKTFFNSGIYNAGFFAFKANERAAIILNWLHDRLEKYCFVKVAKGLFVDQIWFNHIPVLFEGVLVLKNKGYNAAYWNVGERTIVKHQQEYFVEDKNGEACPLVFFHFSGYDIEKPAILSKYQNKYAFDRLPVLKELFDGYAEQLTHHHHKVWLKNESAYYPSSGIYKLLKLFK